HPSAVAPPPSGVVSRQPLRGGAPLPLLEAGQTSLPENFLGLLRVSIRLLEGLLTVDHPCAGGLAEARHLLCGDRWVAHAWLPDTVEAPERSDRPSCPGLSSSSPEGSAVTWA